MNRFDHDLLTQLANHIVETEYWSRMAFPVTTGGMLTANVSALSETGQLLATRALEAWTEVTGIRFELVESDDTDIDFSDARATPFAEVDHKNGIITSVTINIPAARINESQGRITSGVFDTLVHELGHALGLAHPGPYSENLPIFGEDNLFANDSVQASAMSYFSQTSNTNLDASFALPVTPMIADIIALHDKYGVPTLRGGDTVYGVGSGVGGHLGALFADLTAGNLDRPVTFTLFDSGGQDTLDFSTDTDNQHVVLQPETASDVYGLRGNLVIARDTIIENYVAGSGDDIITGNEADNVLEGRAGANTLDGSEGSDTAAYTGSATAVTINLSDGTATGGDAQGDTFTSIENLSGSAHADTLIGDASDNILEGAAGADTLDGGAGRDTASYTASHAAVTVNLLTGTATGGHAAGDTVAGIENLLGSRYNDVLNGDAGANRLDGGPGNDRLTGGAGADVLVGGPGADAAGYAASAGAVTVNLGTNTATGGDAQGDTFDSIENLSGSAHNDTLVGDASDNILEGAAGADTLDGGAGTDTVSYSGSSAAVTVRLLAGAGARGDAEGDTLSNIENLIGSAYNDTFGGDASDNILEGAAGADTLDGGAGIDTVSYSGSREGVTVRLLTGAGARGDAEGDTLSNIENLIGSAYNDTFGGDTGNNVLRGGTGNDGLWSSGDDDTLIGGPGSDRVYGGAGQDTVSYTGSPEGVTVRLHSLVAAGGDATGDTFPGLVDVAYTDADGVEQTDSLPDVERLTGSAHADILAGDRRDNVIDGGAGDDTLYGGPGGGDDDMTGGPGNDRLFGGQGDDTLSGGPGDDRLAGGPGDDVFVFGPGEGADTVTDFAGGTDSVDLTAFDIEGIDALTMTTGADGVTIDLSDSGGGSLLLAGLTVLPEAGDFLI